jgi:hypothetical protein
VDAAWVSPETDQDPISTAKVAGDVDGDGFGDLLVAGITVLRLYSGSATGLSGPLWTSD